MKSKNKFTNNFNLISTMKNVSNNFKNSKYINPAIIILIITFSIYLLYFNDKIYVQDTITNSLNENNNTGNNDDTCENSDQDYLVENFDVEKYVDVCKNRNTRIYNLGNTGVTSATITSSSSTPKAIDQCEKICNDNSCQVFTLSGNVCYTYKRTPPRSSDPIKISCDSKIFAPSDYNSGSYNGIGYINNSYFKNNKTDFSYIDPFLIESKNVLRQLYTIDNSRNILMNYSLSDFNNNYNRDSLAILTGEVDLFSKFTTLNTKLFDISRNKLYTDKFNFSDAISESILAPVERDIPFMKDVDDKYNMVKKSDNLDGVLAVKSENFIVNNYRYLILTFIMVITIIMLVLYKSSNFINEKILIAYIIIVTFIVLFITHQLKL
jgi:hypothetical protein